MLSDVIEPIWLDWNALGTIRLVVEDTTIPDNAKSLLVALVMHAHDDGLVTIDFDKLTTITGMSKDKITYLVGCGVLGKYFQEIYEVEKRRALFGAFQPYSELELFHRLAKDTPENK